MSNYLQFKLLIATACALVLAQPFAQSENDQKSDQQLKSQTAIEDIKKDYQTGQISVDKVLNLLDAQKGKSQAPESLPPEIITLKNKCLDHLKSYLYDPEHPALFFEKLVSGFSFYLSIHKQTIYYVEKVLGKDNPDVLKLKQSYTDNLKYLDALKQQKLLLEQSKQSH